MDLSGSGAWIGKIPLHGDQGTLKEKNPSIKTDSIR